MMITSPVNRENLVVGSEASRLISPREINSPGQWWKQFSAASQRGNQTPNAIGSLIRAVAAMRRRGDGPDQNIHPFCIYNVPQAFCPAADPDLGYDPAVDAWRTFAVRSGIVALRSKFYQYFDYGYGNPYWFDYTVPFVVDDGTDGGNEVENYDDPSVVFRATPQIIMVGNTGDFGAAAGTGPAVFVLDKDVSWGGTGGMEAYFWLAIDEGDVDNPPTVTVKCRMWTTDIADSTGRTTQAWPDPSPANIPIGFVGNAPSDYNAAAAYSPLTVGQFLYDHVISHTPGVAPIPEYIDEYFDLIPEVPCAPMVFRGDWDLNTLSGQVFYKGDVISAQANDAGNQVALGTITLGVFSPSQTVAMLQTFLYIQDVGIETDKPNDTSTNWQKISGLPGIF